MRSTVNRETAMSETMDRISALSIVISDFDSVKNSNTKQTETTETPNENNIQTVPRPYTRQSSDASIRKILEEAETRKHEFWKLIEEHDAVIENLKKIEQQDTGSVVCKNSSPPIKI